MDNTDHIFTPQDDSLSERMRAYGLVVEAYRNAEASLKYLDDSELSAQLGEREEVERAYEICKHSFHIASQAISQGELQEAKEQGLLSDKEVQEFLQSKRLTEMQERRANQTKAESQQQTRKR